MCQHGKPIEGWKPNGNVSLSSDGNIPVAIPAPVFQLPKRAHGKLRRHPAIPPEGVDEILDSASAMARNLYTETYTAPALLPLGELMSLAENDIIPMSELEPIGAPSMSSSVAEFLGLENLDRPELDEDECGETALQSRSVPFAAPEGTIRDEGNVASQTPSEDAAVREDPFSRNAV